MEPENPLLDEFVLSLSRRQPARVCFIPTASADSPKLVRKRIDKSKLRMQFWATRRR